MSHEFQRSTLSQTRTIGRFVQHEASTAHRMCKTFGGEVNEPANEPAVAEEKIDTEKPPPVETGRRRRRPALV